VPCYGILGPLYIGGHTDPVLMRSRLQRLILAVLLVEANRTVTTDRLADELWGDHLPDDPGGALRSQVSRLRKALPEDTPLITDAGGYRLRVNGDDIDVARFEQLLAAALGMNGADALHLIDDALALWRGAPLGEFIDRPFAQIEARRLEELRGGARERRASLLIAAGRSAEATAELEALLAEQPEREHARALLMEALYQQGRHTSAIDVYQSWRSQLVDEYGLEPSPALQQLEGRILRHTAIAPEAAQPASVVGVAVPRPVSSFIGRDTDLRGVGDLLGRERLVTLWGPGGVGKTRLAVEVGARVSHLYPDGVHVCDLTVLTPGASVARAVANILGVHELGGRGLEAQIVDRLARLRTLVILDNCEHVLEDAAQLVRHLVQSTAWVDVLVTSRERLGVDAEHVWEVAPLAVGGPDSPAVALFLDRARASDRSFVATSDALDTIARVCQRLDGLPLGLELAAARVRGLAIDRLLQALEQRFEILTGGAGSPPRHRSLRAVIDWSYAQLGVVEQAVFDRLSIFRGLFDLDAATAVAAGDGIERAAVVPAVLRLLDCALVVVHDGSRRYSMLDTVRHYGLEQLAAQHILPAVSDRHARWVLAEVERAGPGLGTASEAEWATTIERCVDELRAAQAWLVGRDLEASLRLNVALRPYALWRGHSEMFRWAEGAAAAASGTGHALLSEVLLAAATGAWQRGDVDAATTAASAAERAALGLGDAPNRAALEASGDVAFLTGDLDRAVAAFTESYALAAAAGDLLQAVWDLGSAAVAIAYRGDTIRALAIAGEVASTAERSQSPSATAFGHFVLGEILAGAEPQTAEMHLRRAIEIATTTDSKFVVGLAEVALAASRMRQRDVPTALTYCESAVRRWHTAGAWAPLWTTLRTVIALLIRVGATDDAAVLYGVAASPSGTRVAPYGADALMLRKAADELRDQLGDDEYSRLLDAGRTMAPDEAVQFSLDALARVSLR
jgi:predicted ATPase/DNA-binding SARP family transcriptional activator